ncbi:MAG: transglycosylase family protein [Acidimicrobiia bacterium]|nr:transglycosylase family protein [Acidimicrobiia bacterium]
MLVITRSRLLPALILSALLLALVGGVGVARAIDSTQSGRAGVASVDEALTQVDLLRTRVDELRAEIEVERTELADLEARTSDLGAEQAALVAEAETSVRQNRELVVSAFITGGEAESERLLATDRAADYQWQTYLLRSESVQVANLAERLGSLREATDAEVLALAERLDSGKSYLAVAERQLERSQSDLAQAQVELVVAEAWELSDRAVAQGRFGEAPAEAWERLRSCESRGDYRVVNATGVYRGAYQFDLQTWRAMGGTGDPINATPPEQDARARALYALRGSQPWPECGRHLP